MKIIGETPHGFILEAEKNEVYQLIGYYYSGSNNAPRLKPGDEIRVNEMYNQLETFKKNERTLEYAKGELLKAVQGIDIVVPLMRSEEKEEEVKET